MITDDQRRVTAEHAHYHLVAPHAGQQALKDDVDWMHQPGFDREFERLTGESTEYVHRWHDLMTSGPPRWNFTADDRSFT